jgi:hypothetical protein
VNHTQRGVREINGEKNFLDSKHGAPAGESDLPTISLRTCPTSLGV